MRKLSLCLIACTCVLAGLSGCGSSGGGGAAAAPDYQRALAGSPPELARLHRQGSKILEGGAKAFDARLRSLRGRPVVVNKWASWCGPCRLELPWLQSLSARLGKRVAFLGINSNDGRGSAADFQRDYPVPYPSYRDPKLDVAKRIGAVQEFPATAFYDRDGKLAYTRRGAYPNRAAMAADIRRYAR